jgi:NADH-quinone oxidoreductase subunit H
VVALAVSAHSFRLRALADVPFGPVHLAAAAAFVLAVPARLKLNPFSIPNAEQEIVAGSLTEYSGAPLALFELAHGLELTALVGILAALLLPAGDRGAVAWVRYLATGGLLVALVTLVAAATARLTVQQAFRFYWRWGAVAGGAALLAAAL